MARIMAQVSHLLGIAIFLNLASIPVVPIAATVEIRNVSATSERPKVNCSDAANTMEINEAIRNAHYCFKNLVNADIGLNVTDDSCTTLVNFKSSAIDDFLEAASHCESDQLEDLANNLYKFVNVVNRTIPFYKDLYNHRGVQCVNAKRTDIESCMRNITYRTNVTLGPQLFINKFATMDFKQGCADHVRISKCVINSLMEIPRICTNQTIRYTEVLYDTIYDEFCNQTTEDDGNKGAEGSSHRVGAPISILFVLLVFLQHNM